jgi:hypothetical protein
MKNNEYDLPEIDYDKKFLKKRANGLLLTDEHVEILKRYNIDYENCISMTELLYKIDNTLFDVDDYELEMVATDISERNYYNNTRK